ncbi:MAG TPA: ribosome small subunit-dependent GTPase A [Polyangiaceae bacterium]
MASISGLPAHFAFLFDSLGRPELTLGRVVYGAAGLARVQVSAHDSLTCSARPGDDALVPVTGDWVAIDRSAAVISHVFPRESEFSRRAPGRATTRQVLAANMDWVFILMALDQDFSVRRIERYLALCHASRARPVVFLTKAGAASDVPRALAEVQAVANDTHVHAIDVVCGIEAEGPHDYLGDGVTAAVLGSSGVGKSTLVNHLLGRQVTGTKAVRQSDGKGRHTTTGRELFVLENGSALIDTPGLRELALWADSDDIHAVFPELAELAAGCRFRDCRHGTEPGCAVRAASEHGEVGADRLESYRKLLTETETQRVRRTDHERRAHGRKHARLVRDVLARKYGKHS